MSEIESRPSSAARKAQITTSEQALNDEVEASWTMPEPVFRCSAGKLQKPKARAHQNAVETYTASKVADIGPQPEISEPVADYFPEPAPMREHNSRSSLHIALLVIALIVMAVSVIAFFVAVYLLFFAGTSDGI